MLGVEKKLHKLKKKKMPIPKPNENETKEKFMDRCMSDDTMKKEYDNKQRYAICETKFDEVKRAISAKNKKALQKKVTDHNEEVKDLNKSWNLKVTYAKLEKVFDRGKGAFTNNPSSVRPGMNQTSWALARVNSFLYAIKKGKFRGGKHDTDLLPNGHPVKEAMKEKKNNINIWDNMNTTEKRFFDISLEKRNSDENENTVVVGHAAVFNRLSENLGGFQERILPGAFDDVLENDVRAFFNHDPNHLLARSSSGTLRLSVDDKGLKYEFDVPNTTSGRDLLVSLERGDITQSSFAFTVQGDSWAKENGVDVRSITKVKRLYDVSPVSIPAYPDANDLAVAQRSLAIEKEKQQKKEEEIDLISRNLLELKLKIIKKKK